MNRKSRPLWLALFAAAIALGVWQGSRRAAPDPLDPSKIFLSLGPDGRVRVQAADGTDASFGPLTRDDPAAADASLAALSIQLARLGDRQRDDVGYSGQMAILAAAPEVPWYRIQWLLMTMSQSKVRIWHLGFTRLGDGHPAVPMDLPKDGWAPPEPPKVVRAALAWRSGSGATRAHTAIGVGFCSPNLERLPLDCTPADQFEDGIVGLSRWVAAHSAEIAGIVADILTPLPSGTQVPYGDVLAAMRLLHAAGAKEFRLMGAPEPFPKAHR